MSAAFIGLDLAKSVFQVLMSMNYGFFVLLCARLMVE